MLSGVLIERQTANDVRPQRGVTVERTENRSTVYIVEGERLKQVVRVVTAKRTGVERTAGSGDFEIDIPKEPIRGNVDGGQNLRGGTGSNGEIRDRLCMFVGRTYERDKRGRRCRGVRRGVTSCSGSH